VLHVDALNADGQLDGPGQQQQQQQDQQPNDDDDETSTYTLQVVLDAFDDEWCEEIEV
jgi:hypothetical protein